MGKNILPENAAVLYLRMSSAKQDKSIPAQRDELLKIARRKGYTIVREYVDPAVSGDDTEKRTGFLQLREDCENGPDFSIILVWHEDRFSRNDPLEYGYWLKPIRDSGVILETPTGRVDWESLGGRLLSLIGQEMRHDYLRQLSRNVARGQLAAAKNGDRRDRRSLSGRLQAERRRDRRRSVWAEIVRRIFEEYLKPGASLRSVTSLLNGENVPSTTRQAVAIKHGPGRSTKPKVHRLLCPVQAARREIPQHCSRGNRYSTQDGRDRTSGANDRRGSV